ncbi:MAG: group III truncated hemoglobin, partial [Phyllobacterium sp.]
MTSQDKASASGQTKPLTSAGNPIPDDLDEDLIHKVVHEFYGRVRNDELLAPLFNERIDADQWPVHLEKMCDFWSSSLLRTSRYRGHPLRPHLGLSGLGDAHFERWLSLFHATVSEVCSREAGA